MTLIGCWRFTGTPAQTGGVTAGNNETTPSGTVLVNMKSSFFVNIIVMIYIWLKCINVKDIYGNVYLYFEGITRHKTHHGKHDCFS